MAWSTGTAAGIRPARRARKTGPKNQAQCAQQRDGQGAGATPGRTVINHGRPARIDEGMAENSRFTGSQIPGNDDRVRRCFYDWER